MSRDDPPINSRLVLVLAAVAVMAIRWFVPFGGTILYPFTLLGTWVHEMGHGLTSLLLGGGFNSLDIFANASGLAHTVMPAGWRMGFVAAGGLLAPPALGATILAVSRGPRRVQVLLWVLTGALLLSLIFWVRSVAGWVSLPILAAGIGVFARYGGNRERMFVAQLLGVLLALDTWTGLGYLFRPSAIVDGVERASDISLVASSFFGPYQLWGVLLSAISFVLLAAGLAVAWRRPRSPRSIPSLGIPRPASLASSSSSTSSTSPALRGARVGTSQDRSSASLPQTREELDEELEAMRVKRRR